MKTIKLSLRLNLIFKTFCFLIVLINLLSCKEDFNGYYDPPEGLEGPIYEQLSNDPDFSEFTKAIDKLPTLKKAINTSGLYTVFAPTNDAMTIYLAKIGKSSVDAFNMQIEADSLALYKLVNSHFLYNMYFTNNFDKLIDETENPAEINFSSNDIYRFGTRFREPDYTYFDKNFEVNRKVRSGNKVVSIYTQKYIDKYKMSPDYEDLFGTAPGDFNIEGVQVLENKRDIAAKNGVIHGINKVIEVIPTIDRILAEKNPYFSNLLESFVLLQFEDIEGIDSIFSKDYIIGRNFSSDNEINTLFCPETGEFNDFVDNNVLVNFDNTFDSVPNITAFYLIASYYVGDRRWLSDIKRGVINGVNDTIKDPVITDKIVASNGLVYVTSDFLLSSAFTTVIKEVLLNKEYSWFLDLINMVSENATNIIELLRYKENDYTFFIPTNEALKNFGIEKIPDDRGGFNFYLNGLRMYSRATDTLINNLIVPDEIFDPVDDTYKWHQTRSGNFLLIKNGKINGGITCLDKTESDNGNSFQILEMPLLPNMSISSYLNVFEENSSFNTIIKKWFHDEVSQTTIDTTGETIEYLLSVIDGSSSYTVFVPTDAALLTYKNANGLGDYDTDSIWQDIAQYHIVQTRLFSEGSFEQKAENPLPGDKSKFLTLYKDIVYSPENIFAKDHYAWLQFIDGQQKIRNQDSDEANITATFDYQAKNGVIHHVDKVLAPPVRQFPDNE